MILPTSKQCLIDHTVSLLEALHCIKVLITGKFAQTILHFFKVEVKQKLHWNMFRTVNCIISFLRESRFFLGCLAFTFKPGLVLRVWFLCMDTFAIAIGWINCNDQVPLLIPFWLFYRFLSLIAKHKRNIIHFVQKLFPLVICGASDTFSREGMLLLFISLSVGAKHCNRLTRRYVNVN